MAYRFIRAGPKPLAEIQSVGAVLGGWLFNLFGGTGVTGFNIDSVYSAGIAAIILLAALPHLLPPPHATGEGTVVDILLGIGADDLAQDQAQHEPSKIHTIINIGHSRQRT